MKLHILPYGGRPHNVYRRRPQDVGRRGPLELHVGQYGTTSGRYIWRPQDVIFPCPEDVGRECPQEVRLDWNTLFCVGKIIEKK